MMAIGNQAAAAVVFYQRDFTVATHGLVVVWHSAWCLVLAAAHQAALESPNGKKIPVPLLVFAIAVLMELSLVFIKHHQRAAESAFIPGFFTVQLNALRKNGHMAASLAFYKGALTFLPGSDAWLPQVALVAAAFIQLAPRGEPFMLAKRAARQALGPVVMFAAMDIVRMGALLADSSPLRCCKCLMVVGAGLLTLAATVFRPDNQQLYPHKIFPAKLETIRKLHGFLNKVGVACVALALVACCWHASVSV